jgi:serine/threonine protein kinase
MDTNLGANAEFILYLRQSQLLEHREVDQLVAEASNELTEADPILLADWLVDRRALTRFQADRILKGQPSGLVLGPYVLEDEIGEGSLGTIYRGRSRKDGKAYELKLMPRRDMVEAARSQRHLRAFRDVRHASVVPFVDFGLAGDSHYLVWPLVEGETLDAAVERDGKLKPGAAAALVAEVARGLAACHEVGLKLGLLTPRSVLIDSEGRARILEGGIGAILAQASSVLDTGRLSELQTGLLACASPESLLNTGHLSAEADQYCLGCLLYYSLAGRMPFEGGPTQIMMGHQMQSPPPLSEVSPDVPDELARVVERMLEKKPEDRFPSALDVADALDPFADRPAAPAVEPARPAPVVPRQSPQQRVPPSSAPRRPIAPSSAPRRPIAPPPPEEPEKESPSEGRMNNFVRRERGQSVPKEPARAPAPVPEPEPEEEAPAPRPKKAVRKPAPMMPVRAAKPSGAMRWLFLAGLVGLGVALGLLGYWFMPGR